MASDGINVSVRDSTAGIIIICVTLASVALGFVGCQVSNNALERYKIEQGIVKPEGK